MKIIDSQVYYTVKEYAEKIGKSRQTVTNWVNSGRFGAYLRELEGFNHISAAALDDPSVGNAPQDPVKPIDQPVEEVKQPDEPVTPDFTAYLLGEIDRLRSVLDTKDTEIAELRRQLGEHTERLTAITEESQRIAKQALDTAGNAQKLQAVSMLPSPEAEPEEPKKGRGLFSRFRK